MFLLRRSSEPSRNRTYIKNLEGFCPNPLDDRPFSSILECTLNIFKKSRRKVSLLFLFLLIQRLFIETKKTLSSPFEIINALIKINGFLTIRFVFIKLKQQSKNENIKLGKNDVVKKTSFYLFGKRVFGVKSTG